MAVSTPTELREFVTYQADVEALLQRCGLDTYDLLLIDLQGNWTRWIFPSQDEAVAVADTLGVPLHRRWDDRMTRRMNKRDHWNEPGGQRRAL